MPASVPVPQSVRRQAMRVGHSLSALLDPSKPPMFGEDDPQLQQLLPEEAWYEQAAAAAAAPRQLKQPPQKAGGAAATGAPGATPGKGSGRQERREARERRRREREARRQRAREEEAEGPLTETDSDDEVGGIGDNASSVTSSGTACSTSSGEFEQYDLEESDEEDPARSRLQVGGREGAMTDMKDIGTQFPPRLAVLSS